mmetsp:Transcript_13688/g.33129  ORF Transcript_13688/g.33129 Transcript_13688/m.33129 type:complete len:81 (-) Transcript_13688:414-656(-)
MLRHNSQSTTMKPCLLFLWLNNIVDNRIEENSSNANTASQELHKIERFTKDHGHANDDNDPLSRVGYRLGDSISLLECHG